MSRYRNKPCKVFVSSAQARVCLALDGGDVPRELCVTGDFRQAPEASSERLWQALRELGSGALTLEIVIADDLVRYLAVDLVDGIRSAPELEALARARHREVFGPEADEWQVALDFEWRATRHLSTAVANRLLNALSGPHKPLAVRSIRPAFVAAQRKWHRQLRRPPFWFAFTDGEHTALGYRERQGWAGVRVHREVVPSYEKLVTLLEGSRLYLCPDTVNDIRKVWISGAYSEWPANSPGPHQGFDIEELPASAFCSTCHSHPRLEVPV